MNLTSVNLLLIPVCGKYGDDGAIAIARHLPILRILNAELIRMGWEGATAFSNNLGKISKLDIRGNAVGQGVSSVGRLPKIRNL